jgi:DNA repair protein RecO
MRHKYSTRAIIFGRTPLADASAGVVLLTEEFGLIRARAQGLRKSGAKMAQALQSLSTADITLIKGKDGWRLTGAILESAIAQGMDIEKRLCVGRIFELVKRLVRGEHHDILLYGHIHCFIETLPLLTNEEQDAAECLVALRVLHLLGHDGGDLPQSGFETETLAQVRDHRKEYIQRINHALSVSGL